LRSRGRQNAGSHTNNVAFLGFPRSGERGYCSQMTRIALIGAQGQLGSDLMPRLPTGTVPLDHSQIEITDADAIADVLGKLSPSVVINTAAYNLVDRAEDEPDVAYRVNALGPRILAHWCAEHGARLVHISSDYVFGLDGERSTPYAVDDAPGPVSAYGLSKLAGEYFVRAAGPEHLVIRTCGLYGQAATRAKGNFVTTMLRLGKERDELRIVDDQRCTPTYTADLANAIARLIDAEAGGLHHVTNSGSMTWCEFAREIFRLASLDVRVVPITSAEFGAAARRPGYSVLDCSRTEQTTKQRMRSWQEALREFVESRA